MLYLIGGASRAGKSMLAERLPGLLPPLDAAQALEVTAIASLSGRIGRFDGLCRRPPFVAPHHGASMAAIIGGGIVNSAGCIPSFTISAALSVVMIAILIFLVKDPRTHLTADHRR